MSRTRTITLASLAILTVTAFALATFPATAEEEAGFDVAVAIDETFPRTTGTVTVTDTDGNPIPGAVVHVSSTSVLAPDAPAATASGGSRTDGTFAFAFGYASTASLPGEHVVTVTVQFGGVNETAETRYTVPDL